MKFTKLAFAAAFCALFAVQADARTLYVNSKRPNNKGNGYRASTAKKTIQAAINVAKKGDTILVYPGTYTSIKTNNKKITIKGVKGQKKTKIKKRKYFHVADLSNADAEGKATTLVGFFLDGGKSSYGVLGGTLKSCTMQNFWSEGSAICRSVLSRCLVKNNYIYTGSLVYDCRVLACKITENKHVQEEWWSWHTVLCQSSTLVNCLIDGNSVDNGVEEHVGLIENCSVLNCTIVNNVSYGNGFTGQSKFYNCILWNNVRKRNVADDEAELTELHNVDSGNIYRNTDKTNKNPKFVNTDKGNYKLKKGSYAINSGKLTKAQKKLVGTKDLAGRKRIRGKAIDRGCYEY